jgi:hypothetical protein
MKVLGPTPFLSQKSRTDKAADSYSLTASSQKERGWALVRPFDSGVFISCIVIFLLGLIHNAILHDF